MGTRTEAFFYFVTDTNQSGGIKCCHFTALVFIKEQNNRIMFICVKNVLHVKSNHCVQKVSTDQYYVEQREWLRKKMRGRLNSVEGKLKYLTRMRIESVFGNINTISTMFIYTYNASKKQRQWQLIWIGHNLKKIHQLKMA